MSVEQSGTIDLIGDEGKDGIVYLGVTDHLDWAHHQREHLLLLQEKLNTYIQFVESGQIYDGREHLKSRRLQIKVFGQHPLNQEATEFYARASAVLKDMGIDLAFEQRDESGNAVP